MLDNMKPVLVQGGGATWTALGSLYGGEIGHTINRDEMLLTDQPAVANRLLEVFLHDWQPITS